MGGRHLSGIHVVHHAKELIMGLTGGLIAIVLAVGLTIVCRARNGEERPFARNWMALVGVTMAVMTLFIAGLAA